MPRFHLSWFPTSLYDRLLSTISYPIILIPVCLCQVPSPLSYWTHSNIWLDKHITWIGHFSNINPHIILLVQLYPQIPQNIYYWFQNNGFITLFFQFQKMILLWAPAQSLYGHPSTFLQVWYGLWFLGYCFMVCRTAFYLWLWSQCTKFHFLTN
jgi:hypothetical protein